MPTNVPAIRTLLATLLFVAAVVSAGAWYFSSGHTRLTGSFWRVADAAEPAARLPHAPAHVIVVIEENKSYGDIVGNSTHAPYLNSLIARGALLTDSHAVAHPSQPNYMALFSGLTNDDGDNCNVHGIARSARSLGGELLQAGYTFVGYAEDLPSVGFSGCYAGEYARKHVPWTHFDDVPAGDSRPFTQFPPYDQLPTVAFVIPNLVNDMHSASIDRGDAWLRAHVGPLIDWAMHNDTLVIVTWDEDDGTLANHIATLFIGSMVRPGRYDLPITHESVLRTLEDFYHLPYAGASADARPIFGSPGTPLWRM